MDGFLLPGLRPVPQILTPGSMPKGAGRTILVIVAHADDAAIFLGGTLALWADAGWRLVAVRATDDRWDSVGLDEAETITRNAREFRAAARALGIAEVQDLGLATDTLGDVSRVDLRERLIRAIRLHRPYGIATFDPDSILHEDNLDHRVLAEAAAEAAWCAMFDKHHPEHLADGLAPHGVVERWYFGRSVPAVTHVVDTATTLDRQIEAILLHSTPLANIAAQLLMQARTARVAAPLAEAASLGDPRPMVIRWLTRAAEKRGVPFGLEAADYLRLHKTELDWLTP